MKVQIKRLSKAHPLPAYATSGSVAFDLGPAEDAVIEPGAMQFLPTGVVICTPPGYMLMIAARSSTYLKYGLVLANSVGIVDQDFCGPDDEIKLQVRNATDQPVRIAKGTRIAQAMFVKIERGEWEEVEKLDNPSRGGWGSTGH